MKKRETSRWLSDLRREFVRIASRRVDTQDVEDVVQEALRIIAEKGLDRGAEPVAGTPPLAWCFQVLRNTIGNHYQRRRTRQRWVDTGLDGTEGTSESPVLEALDSGETLLLIETALNGMSRTDPACARYLTRLADGDSAGYIADEESIERAAFYRRLYRCRRKLRDILSARGLAV